MSASVTIVCPQCLEHSRGRVEMAWQRELEQGNVFDCPTCGGTRLVTKDKTGGTYGQGDKNDGRRGAYGSGFGAGTATFRGRADRA